jgi:hypothetical protein
MKYKFLLALAALTLASLPAFAQSNGTPVNIRGTIDKLDGQTLNVTTREGPKAAIKLNPDVAVSGTAKKSLADIKQGDYIACTAMMGADGKLHALEVHLFPPDRHPADTQRPYDLAPQSVMTNATVAEVASVSSQGKTLNVTFKQNNQDQKSVIEIGPDVPVVMAVPGDASLLKPGATVFIAAVKKDDGSLSTSRITAEKDGVKPPM